MKWIIRISAMAALVIAAFVGVALLEAFRDRPLAGEIVVWALVAGVVLGVLGGTTWIVMIVAERWKQGRRIQPDERGLLPITTSRNFDEIAVASLAAFHQTQRVAAQPRMMRATEQQGPVLPADTASPLADDTRLDLADLKVDLITRLHPNTGGSNILLGVNDQGQEIRGDIHSMMHTLSAATTGGGKTTLLSSLGLQLAFDPNVSLLVADPHLQELALLEDTGALIRPLPTNHAQAVALLIDLAAEVRHRAEVIAAASEQLKLLDGRRPIMNRIDKFNSMCHRLGLQPLPAIVAFGDELRGLMDDKRCAQAVDIITSEGRKFGIYFVGGSQSWKADVVDTATRSMFWTRYLLPGIPVQQAASILEIDQKTAKPLVNSLTAPGICALWRRGHQTQVVKAPYIDLESDSAWDMIEAAAATRGRYGSATLQSATDGATDGCYGALRGSTAGATNATSVAAEDCESDAAQPGVAVTDEERQRILQARDTIIQEGGNPSKREICRRAFDGATGGQAFKKVRQILDNLNDDPPDAFRGILN